MDCGCSICQNNKQFDLPQEIIEAARKCDLVLFCGAGISTESHHVLPFTLYDSIKNELNIQDEDISFSQLMQLYCNKPDGRKKLLIKIKERFDYINSFPEIEGCATAFHQELSTIYQIRTIITTNWDTYFEEYCGATPITIPADYAFWDESSRYVLKIHGSINNLSTIIATTTDYKDRFTVFQNGIIGATLKHILATKTVVFIGYSFRDEDFNQIIKYINNEMGDIYPHIYVVTLDEELSCRFNYKNATFIVTSGTYFLHQLRLALIDFGEIVNNDILPKLSYVLDEARHWHKQVSSLDIHTYPDTIFTLSYQDGVIHALERCLKNYKTGEYNHPCQVRRLAQRYQIIIQESHQKKNFWDEAYYEGYLNGLILIDNLEKNNNVMDAFPFLYLPNSKVPLSSYEIYMRELEHLSGNKGQYAAFARKLVKNMKLGLIVHHPPY
ncbi:MAG: SIR2 family protein [Clostridiales bacterium]|nr:SIR2 family protein [Clostridiales bacterium]